MKPYQIIRPTTSNIKCKVENHDCCTDKCTKNSEKTHLMNLLKQYPIQQLVYIDNLLEVNIHPDQKTFVLTELMRKPLPS
jgi:hypothetical protein